MAVSTDEAYSGAATAPAEGENICIETETRRRRAASSR